MVRNRKISIRTLSKNTREAGEWYGAMFGTGPSDEIFLTRRLYSINGMPRCLEEVYSPDGNCLSAGLHLNDPDWVWSAETADGMWHVFQTIQTAVPHQDDRRLLGIDDEWPVFLIQREYKDVDGRMRAFQRIFTVSEDDTIYIRFAQEETEDGRIRR